MAHTATWNAAYEAGPADGDDVGDGATDIRQFKRDVRERIAMDHYMAIAGTDADHGEHSKVTFQAQYAAGSPGANKAFLYTKDVNSKAELHFKDEDDNEVQITRAGSLESIPSGEIILFEKDTVVAGYTLQTDVDDKMVFISKGSAAGGQTGAGNHSTGTWTISGLTKSAHTHSLSSHTHALAVGAQLATAANKVHHVSKGGSDTLGGYTLTGGSATINALTSTTAGPSTANSGAQSSAGVTSAGTWRPAARVFTRQSKD